MATDILTKRCPYCREEKSIVSMTARTIAGYKNPLSGKDTAMVEKLSCGHEFVDGKFNVDSLYYSSPTPITQEEKPKYEQTPTITSAINVHHHYKEREKTNGINVMDILCILCAGILAIMFPPLIVIPILYFIARIKKY